MNYQVIELGKNYLVAHKSCQRKIVGRVISKSKTTVTVQVEKYEGVDHDAITQAKGLFETPYSSVYGRAPERYFFS